MIENGLCQHQPIQDGDAHADFVSFLQVPQQSAGAGTMDQQLVSVAGMQGWDHKGSAILDKSYMTDHGFIDDSIDRFPVVVPSLRQSLDSVSWMDFEI